MTSGSRLRLYAPFLALALVQGVIVVVAPSKSARTGGDASVTPGDQSALPLPVPTAADPLPGSTGLPTALSTQPARGPRGAAQGSVVVPGPGRSSTVVRGDVSHCTRDGRQHAVVFQAPPCVPRWTQGTQNGGVTAPGVTASEITVVFFREEKNPVVEALINREGLSRTVAQEKAFLGAAIDFLHKRYELYGRRIKLIYYEADCPETPPDVPACRSAAREVIRLKPFAVIWPVPIYPDVFDEFFRAGVVAIGGWHFANPYFSGRRPYRWDYTMDGTQTADFVSDYYCAKLARRPATHSGESIHASIGARGAVTRKLGIIVQENPANVASAQHVAARIKTCGGGDTTIVTYASDIERAQTQASANVSALIAAGVTTVICLGEPIAPIFRTATMTEQRYFPEHLLAGQGLLDYDKLGRLYEPQQWAHAFGLSHLNANNQVPVGRTDATKIWSDAGRSGDACEACNVPAAAVVLLGLMLQQAGPALTAVNIERGMFATGDRGGWAQVRRADVSLARFGPGDYTLISDVREVYWSATTPSGLDGRPGSYVALSEGRRFLRGQFDAVMRAPVAPR